VRALPFVSLLLLSGVASAAEPAKPDEPKKDEAPPEKKDDKKEDPKKQSVLQKIFAQGEVDPVDRPTKDGHRDSFAFGLELGGISGLAEGFPNDPTKAGKQEFFASTGPAFGGMGTIWIGGALRDFLTFGFGFSGGAAFGAENRTPGYAFLVRVDGYPAFPAGGAWRDFGVGIDTGLAISTLDRQSDGVTLADGAAGKLAFRVFWEGLRVKKLGFGPTVGVDYMFGPTFTRPMAVIGFRMSFYAKP